MSLVRSWAQKPRRVRTPLLPRLIVLAVLLVAGSIILYAVTTRHTYTVTLVPGQTRTLTVELPMQRMGGAMAFAKERNLPVRARVLRRGETPAGADDVGVFVTAAGHSVHRMWARVWVGAEVDAPAGRYRRSIDFTVDGHDNWPRAEIVVLVKNGS